MRLSSSEYLGSGPVARWPFSPDFTTGRQATTHTRQSDHEGRHEGSKSKAQNKEKQTTKSDLISRILGRSRRLAKGRGRGDFVNSLSTGAHGV